MLENCYNPSIENPTFCHLEAKRMHQRSGITSAASSLILSSLHLELKNECLLEDEIGRRERDRERKRGVRR